MSLAAAKLNECWVAETGGILPILRLCRSYAGEGRRRGCWERSAERDGASRYEKEEL